MSQPSIAPSPFDQDSADTIFHTSDHIAYHVHRPILIQASAFFRTMFSLPQPQTTTSPPQSHHITSQQSRIPIIEIEESSETLRTLLTIIYPIPKPKTRAFSVLEPALLAAEKYELELVIDTLKDDLRVATLNPVGGPLRVWAIACRLSLEDIAQHAAAHLNLSQLDQVDDTSVLHGVTAGQYFRLREFCRLRAETPFGAFEFKLLYLPETHGAVMNEAPSSTPEEAAFFRMVAYPDVLVRSSDGAEAPAHRCVLAMASPILRDELSAVLSHEASVDKPEGNPLPVLQLEEPSALLWSLLDSCCYFRAQYLDLSLSQLALIISIAEKYEMEEGLHALREIWVQLVEHSSSNPLVAHLVAAGAGLCMEDFARDTAALVLHQPNSILTQYKPEMEIVPALVYHRLLVYYRECNAAVTAEIEQVMIEHPTLVRWRRPWSQSLNSHGAATSAFSDYDWEAPRLMGEAQWPLHLFLDGIVRCNTKGPQRKIDTMRCDTMLREYMSWGITELPDRPRAHARELFDIVLQLSNRLEVAMKQVDLPI